MNKNRTILKIVIIAAGICLTILFLAGIERSVSAAAKDGLTYENGYYYYYENGEKVTGWKTVGGSKYYFLSNGKAATGLKKVGSYTYFFGTNGAAATGWKTVNGSKYYFGSNGRAKTGVAVIGKYTYVFSDSGKMYTGFKKVTVNGENLYFYLNSAGRSKTGIYAVPSTDYSYYLKGDGSIAKNEIKKIDDKYYYFSTAGKLTVNAVKTINGKIYYFGKDGAALTGWQTYKGGRYYFGSNGQAKRGLAVIGRYTYYFGDTGAALKGFQKLNINGEDKYYFFNSLGRSTTGIRTDSKTGSKYYFYGDGIMAMDEVVNVDGDWYYFNSSGKMQTGYKNFGEGRKYYFGEDGKSQTGIFEIEGKDYSYYFNGDGTISTSEFIEVDGMLLFTTSAGKICKENWRNVGKADLGGEPLYIHCDPETGEVAQGLTHFTRLSDGADCTYYFDINAENGYRRGMVEVSEGETYYFYVSGNVSRLLKGFYTDEDYSVYYFDPDSGMMQTSGYVHIPDTSIDLPVGADGRLDVASATTVFETDSVRTKLIKYAMSQLGRPSGHPKYSSELMIPLDEVPSYNCSGFVMRMYYEVNDQTDIFNRDNDLILYCNVSGDSGDITAGDIVFFNMDNCSEVESDIPGEMWIIDNDNDGICDRIHEDIYIDGTCANVHHVGIYLGNGQMIHSALGKGIVFQSIQTMTNTETFYLFAYGSVSQDLMQFD